MKKSNHSKDWYFSDKAKTEFEKGALQQRACFVQEYLLACSKTSYSSNEAAERNKMRSYYFALFLVDAIYDSSLPYATYPAVIDPEQNPFLEYWVSVQDTNTIDAKDMCHAFVKILCDADHSAVDSLKKEIREKSEQEGVAIYYDNAMQQLPIPDELKIAYELRPVAQKVQWLCECFSSNKGLKHCKKAESKSESGKKFFIAGFAAAVLLIVVSIVISIFAPVDHKKNAEDTDGSQVVLTLRDWENVQEPIEKFSISIENKFDRDLAGLTIEFQFYDSDNQLICTTTLPLSGYMAAQKEQTLSVQLHTVAVEDLYRYTPDEIGIIAEITEINFNDTSNDPQVKNGTQVLKKPQKVDKTNGESVDEKLDAAFALFDKVDINGADFEEKAGAFATTLDEIWEEVTRSDALLEKIYQKAGQYETDEEYEKAYMLFALLASEAYKDSETRAYNCALAASGY